MTPKTEALIQRLRAAIRKAHKGGCKLLSEGSGCACPLCDLDRLEEALAASPAAREEAPLQLIAPEWAEAANDARGLCESEARKCEAASPKTAEHWYSVATRLGALYLAQDHLGIAATVEAPAADRARLERATQSAYDAADEAHAENDTLRAKLEDAEQQLEANSAERARLVDQAHAISHLLELANVGACPITEGVRLLLNRAEKAEAALAESEQSRAQAVRERDDHVAAFDMDRARKIWQERAEAAEQSLAESEQARQQILLALDTIASWGEGAEVTGSFDEPNAARLARKTLAFIGAPTP